MTKLRNNPPISMGLAGSGTPRPANCGGNGPRFRPHALETIVKEMVALSKRGSGSVIGVPIGRHDVADTNTALTTMTARARFASRRSYIRRLAIRILFFFVA